jgi:uncharacterized repeat protein (TIGR03803 family)
VTILHSFSATPDGFNPIGGVAEGADGNFYGTTARGGSGTTGNPNCDIGNGCGAVFKVTPAGVETVLHTFTGTCQIAGACNVMDGNGPYAGLVEGTDGNFYGTTLSGGQFNQNGAGTLFRVTPSGDEVVLYTFGSGVDDGAGPTVGLIQGADGAFYGTTPYGGQYGYGTVYKLEVVN